MGNRRNRCEVSAEECGAARIVEDTPAARYRCNPRAIRPDSINASRVDQATDAAARDILTERWGNNLTDLRKRNPRDGPGVAEK